MFERAYPVTGSSPAEHMHRLLQHVRDREPRHLVMLANPPFERDDLNRIVAVRLRFTPRASDARGSEPT